MQPANNLGYLLQHVATVMAKQADQLLQEQLGIGLSQFKILMVLQKNSQVQQNFIAERLGQTEAGISRQIKILQDKDLLTAKRNPLNLRERITIPTIKGSALTNRAMEVLAKDFEPVFGSMGEGHLKQLTDNLKALHTEICQPGKTGSCDHHI